MDRHIENIARLISEGRWGAANNKTQALLSESQPDAGLFETIDACWSSSSDGRFGFREQRRIWDRLGGPPLVPGYELWNFFQTFGDELAWRKRGSWITWEGVFETPTLPVLNEDDIPFGVPRGCLPFHDVMSSGAWQSEFQTRDCWGEQVWDRWAMVLSGFE
jgi:hypothetical protein